MERRAAGYRRHLTSSPFASRAEPPPAQTFTERERVLHDRYGLGRIVVIEGAVAVVVDFGNTRVRFNTPFDTLTKL